MSEGTLLKKEPLAKYTTWRIGGPAKQLYKPVDVVDLQNFLKTLPNDERILWLGLGSNCLIADEGFDGTVILTQGLLKELKSENNNTVFAEAGVACASFARFCARQNLGGMEFMAGIPGTVGGALRMNAGCFNGETWNFVTEIQSINRHGEIKHRTPAEYAVSYRSVEGPVEDEWFLAARFTLQPGEKATSLKIIRDLLERRANTQPTGEFNCGSVFRNPPGDYAARLIEASGLKGHCIGDAEVSTKHANFIINRGEASAADIEALIAHLAQTVYEQHGVRLQREVCFVV